MHGAAPHRTASHRSTKWRMEQEAPPPLPLLSPPINHPPPRLLTETRLVGIAGCSAEELCPVRLPE